MRILVIRYKKTRGVPEGGEKASELNRTVLCRIAGEENVDTYFIHDEAHRRTAWEYLQGVMYMPLGYYFGLTPQRVKAIVEKAAAYDVVFVDRSVFGIVAKKLKESGYKGRVVCFFHNVETVSICTISSTLRTEYPCFCTSLKSFICCVGLSIDSSARAWPMSISLSLRAICTCAGSFSRRM